MECAETREDVEFFVKASSGGEGCSRPEDKEDLPKTKKCLRAHVVNPREG